MYSMYKQKTNEYFLKRMNNFSLDLFKLKNTSNRPKLHCNAKCIYKYQVQELKMNDTNSINSNTWILFVQ